MIIGFQQGGVFTPPFVVYQPSAPVPTTSEKTSSKKEDKKDSGIDLKEIFGLIRELEGLPGDEDAAFGALKKLFDSIEYKINNPELQYMGSTSSISSDYLKIIRIIDDIKGQAKAYTQALNTATTNNNLSEAAVDSHGRIMVMNEQGFDWVTPEEYYEDRESEQYQIVTNADLLDFRRKGVGGLAFNNSVFNTVANGMGSKQITDLIQGAINDLGKLSSNAPISGYIGVTAGQLINGLDSYIAAVKKSDGIYQSVEDLYKANLLTESQAEQAEQALKYIYFTLPNSAKATLKLKSGVGTDLGALELISSLIASKHSKTYKFDVSLEGGPTKEITGGGNSEDDKTKGNFVLQVQAGFGAHRGLFELNPESAVVMKTDMDVYSGVKTPQGEYIGQTSVLKMLQKSRLLEIAKTDGVYFGNQKIPQEKLKDLLYTQGAFARVEMPVDSNKNPNFKLFRLYEDYKAMKAISTQQAMNMLKTDKYKDLLKILTLNGEPNKEYFRPFMVFDVATSKGLIDIEDDNNFVSDSKSDPELYNSIIKYLSEANPEKAEEYADLDTYDFWGEIATFGQYDHVYKGTLYIPIDMNKAAALSDSNITKQQEEELKYQMANKGYNEAPGANYIKK